MAEKFDLYWDPARPVLWEVLRPGVWAQAEDDEYVDLLTELLKDAPAGGFDVLSDASAYTMQPETSSDETYDMLADAGCRRFIQVVSKSIISLQTARMIRESAAGNVIAYTACSTIAEAEAALNRS